MPPENKGVFCSMRRSIRRNKTRLGTPYNASNKADVQRTTAPSVKNEQFSTVLPLTGIEPVGTILLMTYSHSLIPKQLFVRLITAGQAWVSEESK